LTRDGLKSLSEPESSSDDDRSVAVDASESEPGEDDEEVA
jgi:hypothetical protein